MCNNCLFTLSDSYAATSPIETIKAGKTKVNSHIMSADERNSIKSQVASWLSNYGTSNSMVTSLQNAATNTHMDELIQLFTK